MKNRKPTTKSNLVEFWTGILKDENAELKDRFKASELLAKLIILPAEAEQPQEPIRFEFDKSVSDWIK